MRRSECAKIVDRYFKFEDNDPQRKELIDFVEYIFEPFESNPIASKTQIIGEAKERNKLFNALQSAGAFLENGAGQSALRHIKSTLAEVQA